jgi:acylphosphatase
MTTRRAIVSGRVQGVGFRFFARRAALAEGVFGWVRNREDGTVETVADGDAAAVERYLERLKSGPGHVVSVDAREEPPGRYESFEITR